MSDYRLLSEVNSDVEALEENAMLIDVNPVELLQMAASARKYLKSVGSYSGRVMLGYDFGMTLFRTETGYHVEDASEVSDETLDPVPRWRVDGERVLITLDEIRAHAFAKGTKSYFESNNLEFVLRSMADRQLKERQKETADG